MHEILEKHRHTSSHKGDVHTRQILVPPGYAALLW